MYDYEYEESVLACLYILKYIHDYEPQKFEEISAEISVLDSESLYFMFFDFFDGILGGHWYIEPLHEEPQNESEDTGEDTWYEYEEDEINVFVICHPAFEEFCKLSLEFSKLEHMNLKAHRQKLEDIIGFYLLCADDCIWKSEYVFSQYSLELKIVFAEEIYDTQKLLHVLTDMLLHIRKENDHLRELIFAKQQEAELEEYRKEAA